MYFERHVPAAIVAAAVLSAWVDARNEISDVRREASGIGAGLFTLSSCVSRIGGLLTSRRQDFFSGSFAGL